MPQQDLQMQNILHYWREVRKQGILQQMPTLVPHELNCLVPPAEVMAGQIGVDHALLLFEQAPTALRSSLAGMGRILVYVAPWLIQKKIVKTVDDQSLAPLLIPLWMPAWLCMDGTLHPATHQWPWLSRAFFAPHPTTPLCLGEWALQDDAIFAHLNPSECNWTQWFQLSNELLNSASDHSWRDTVVLRNYTVLSLSLLQLALPFPLTDDPIVSLCDRLLTTDPRMLSPLLQRYCGAPSFDTVSQLTPLNLVGDSALHLAHLGESPLIPQQRHALTRCLQLKESEWLATSRLTQNITPDILKDLVASLWVNAALNENPPPLITVTAFNSQHLAACPLANFKQNHLSWLPEEITHAAEITAEQKNNFLTHARAFLDVSITSIEQARHYLHQAITQEIGLMREGLNLALELHQLAVQLKEKYGTAGIAKQLKKSEKNSEVTAAALNKAQEVMQQWTTLLAQRSFSEKYFPALPQNRRHREHAVLTFLTEHVEFSALSVLENPHPKEISILLQTTLNQLHRQYRSQQRRLTRIRADEQAWLLSQQRWFQWTERAQAEHVHWADLLVLTLDDQQPHDFNLLNWLDITLRQRLWVLTTHYWEARWLEQIEASDEQQQALLQRVRQVSVTEMYKDAQNGTFSSHPIDWLIILDGENALAEEVLPLFVQAKRAIVLEHSQRQPLTRYLTPAFDQHLLAQCGVVLQREALLDFAASGYMHSRGSLLESLSQPETGYLFVTPSTSESAFIEP